MIHALKDLNQTNRFNEIIQELLFQSNPSLKVVIKYSDDKNLDVMATADGLLDELAVSGMSAISGFGTVQLL